MRRRRQLARDGIEVVTLGSTSDYWRIWFFVLEACGLAVQLAVAAQAKNLPARPKTDKLDAQWLARLTEMGLLRASFVPPKAIRDLRDYTRMRTRLIQERTCCFQRRPRTSRAEGLLPAAPRHQAARRCRDPAGRDGDPADAGRAARLPETARPVHLQSLPCRIAFATSAGRIVHLRVQAGAAGI